MFSTADICDEKSNILIGVLPPMQQFGLKHQCEGMVTTVKINTDNKAVIDVLTTNGTGKILCIETADLDYSAIIGDRLAKIAIENQWQGIIVNGAVRDTKTISEMDICIFARCIYPKRGKQSGGGDINIPISINGLEIKPHDYIYADHDGIVVTKTK